MARTYSIKLWLTGLEIGNFLVAISTTGLMALGVIPMSLTLLIVLALLLLVIGVIGRYIDSVRDDAKRLKTYEKYLTESVTSTVPHPSGDESAQ